LDNRCQSAKRTDENSAVIYRWVTALKNISKSAKRTTDITPVGRKPEPFPSPVSRALGFISVALSIPQVLGYCRSSALRTNSSIGKKWIVVSFLVVSLSFINACRRHVAKPLTPPPEQTEKRALPLNSSPQLKLVMDGTFDQVGKTNGYDASYQKLEYPNGDVPIETGVCSDVIVRAFRKGGIDLQKEVHEDMKDNFSVYPRKWGASGPDANIDHRRVQNLQTYFTREGKSLATTGNSDNFLPGDIVTWDLGNGVDHIGMVVNVWYKPSQRYLIVHNIGAGTHMEDALFAWKITGHYRYF